MMIILSIIDIIQIEAIIKNILVKAGVNI